MPRTVLRGITIPEGMGNAVNQPPAPTMLMLKTENQKQLSLSIYPTLSRSFLPAASYPVRNIFRPPLLLTHACPSSTRPVLYFLLTEGAYCPSESGVSGRYDGQQARCAGSTVVVGSGTRLPARDGTRCVCMFFCVCLCVCARYHMCCIAHAKQRRHARCSRARHFNNGKRTKV